MAEPEAVEKTAVERLRDVISQMKEMEHYSRSNVNKLSETWLALEEEMKEKTFAERMSDLLARQTAFEETITALISDLEIECNRRENEAG